MTEENPLVYPFLAAIHGIPPPPSDNILSLRLYSRVLHSSEQGEERWSSYVRAATTLHHKRRKWVKTIVQA